MEPEDLGNLSDDELEARQRAADEESKEHNPAVGEEGDAAAPSPAPAPAPAEAGAPAPAPASTPAPAPVEAAAAPAAGAETQEATGKPDGVLSKDGTRVLPFAALQAERRSARAANSRAERAEQEAEQLRQQIADLKAGKATDADEVVTEEKVRDAEANFPEHGKVLRALFNRAQELEKQIPAKAPSPPAEPSDDPVQDVIDQVPMLLEWQHGDTEKFERAREIDAVLMKSPKWKDKPVVDRFTEVARIVADEHDIPFPTKTSSTAAPAPAPAAAPQTAAQAAQRKTPETLSEFKGGSVADHGSIDPTRASPQVLLARMEGMTDDEIDAHLAKYG